MKKKRKGTKLRVNLVIGIVFAALGVALRVFAPQIAGGRLLDFLNGAGRGALGVGIANLIYFIYWIMPSRRAEYHEMETDAEIQAKDERSRMLRDRAGSYAYYAGLFITVLAAGAFSVLHALGIIAWGEEISLCLIAFLGIQIVLGAVIYACLNRKY